MVEALENAKHVAAGRGGLRVRVGNYRIIYTVQDDVLVVVVVALGRRRDVYER